MPKHIRMMPQNVRINPQYAGHIKTEEQHAQKKKRSWEKFADGCKMRIEAFYGKQIKMPAQELCCWLVLLLIIIGVAVYYVIKNGYTLEKIKPLVGGDSSSTSAGVAPASHLQYFFF